MVIRRVRLLAPVAIAALLVACLAGWFLTRDTAPTLQLPKLQTTLVDQSVLQAAHDLALLADTPAEQDYARDALRLADHEVDQGFAMALHDAETPAVPVKGPLKQLADRIAALKPRIAEETARIAKLTDDDEIELAKAQLALDQDELDDAQGDLARQGGDPHAKLQQALQEHDAGKQNTVLPKVAPAAATPTLAEQFQAWRSLGAKQDQIASARSQASGKSHAMSQEHDASEKQVNQTSTESDQDMKAKLARLRHMSDMKKNAMMMDECIVDCQQLGDVYGRWGTLVASRRRGVLNEMLRSLALILAILLAVVLIDRAIRHAFRRRKDPRQLHQLRVMATIGVQVIGVLLILLAIFGPPSQIATFFGFATAGLTVALKDFIVGFFGWFALMGKNGIKLGDWVEINGVGGEVIEIGLLKTVILEMGNWTSTGHPTGRRVSFVNSFALEGHYFNFSTAGQWLWDELQVTLPLDGDPYAKAELIRQTVDQATEDDARLAEQDWERVTHQYGTRTFSAKPAIDIRPTVNGVNVVVRYITRGPERFEVKSKLFESLVGLLHKPLLSGDQTA
ncbi:MAG: mechanosensitive ion channel domain-containing protein [Bryobacteraceae bacterium]